MFKFNAIVLVALPLLAASAFADTSQNTGYETSYLSADSPASTLTRAQVQAEYARAKAAGELRNQSGFDTASNAPTTASTVTRADVSREYQRARMTGELANLNTDFGVPQQRRVTQ